MGSRIAASDAMRVRRNAVVTLEHAIARIGAWDAEGWLTGECDHDAVYLLQNAKWSLEAMDSPASNRFWDEQRREYSAMLMSIHDDCDCPCDKCAPGKPHCHRPPCDIPENPNYQEEKDSYAFPQSWEMDK